MWDITVTMGTFESAILAVAASMWTIEDSLQSISGTMGDVAGAG